MPPRTDQRCRPDRRARPAAAALTALAALVLCGTAAACSPGGTTATDPATVSRSAPAVGVFALAPGDGFTATGAFERESTCDGAGDLSPGLTFHSVPDGTAELAVSMVDLDNGKVHWLQVRIPATAGGLVQHRLVEGAQELLNDLGEATYDGPCPPSGSTHRYEVTLYALPARFAVDTGTGEQSDPRTVLEVLRTRATASSSFTADYTRGG